MTEPGETPSEEPDLDRIQTSWDQVAAGGNGLDDNTIDLLLSRFARGDDSALGRLVEKEGPRVLRRLEARLPDQLKRRIGASDILQHTMVDLLAVRQRFENRGAAAFRKMLSTMADLSLRQAIRRERAKKRDVIRDHAPPPAFLGESQSPSPVENVAAEQTTPSKALSRQETAAAMKRCFGQLPAADQEIIRLIDYEDVGYDRAAEILGLALKAAQKRHSRAIARLRALVRRDATG